MAIKNLRFSFDVPITSLLGLIATGNAGLKIDVFGDDKPAKVQRLAGKNGVKMIEGPRKPGTGNGGLNRSDNGQPSWLMMLEALAKNPEHTKTTTDLGMVLEAHGLSRKSVSPQLSKMKGDGLVSRIENGVFRLTAKGLREAVNRGYKVANASAPPKKRKKKTKPAAAAHVAAEADHG